jgi:predicted glycosyltransferase
MQFRNAGFSIGVIPVKVVNVSLNAFPRTGEIREHRADTRLLFYSHDGVGLGHVRRNLAIASAVVQADPGAAVLVATSADEIFELDVPPAVDVLKLPGLRKIGNDNYASRHLRMAPAQVKAVRAAVLEAAVASFMPTVLVADKHPLGLGGELVGALRALRATGARAALGLRDILDDRRRVREEWSERDLPRHISELYDRVLVYGDPAIFDPVHEYDLPPEVGSLTRFCGYVCGPVRAERSERRRAEDARPLVVATAGGGMDGFAVLRTFIAAAATMPWQAVVVSGRQASELARATLRAEAAEAGVRFRTFLPRLASWLPDVDALVCMGGYNTLVEAMTAGLPTVCVPRVHPRQEQLIRARGFGQLGLLRTVEPCDLTAGTLRAEIVNALSTPRDRLRARARAALPLEGARAAAEELLELHEHAGSSLVGART